MENKDLVAESSMPIQLIPKFEKSQAHGCFNIFKSNNNCSIMKQNAKIFGWLFNFPRFTSHLCVKMSKIFDSKTFLGVELFFDF